MDQDRYCVSVAEPAFWVRLEVEQVWADRNPNCAIETSSIFLARSSRRTLGKYSIVAHLLRYFSLDFKLLNEKDLYNQLKLRTEKEESLIWDNSDKFKQ